MASPQKPTSPQDPTTLQKHPSPQEQPLLQKLTSLRELLGEHDTINIIVRKKEYRAFLTFAKAEGYVWQSGEEILPNVNKPSRYTDIVAVGKDLRIYQPIGWIASMRRNGKPTYHFADFLRGEALIQREFSCNQLY